jgi:hypothetical protein
MGIAYCTGLVTVKLATTEASGLTDSSMRRRYRSPLRLKGAAKLEVQNNPAHGTHVTGNSFGFIGFRTADDTLA